MVYPTSSLLLFRNSSHRILDRSILAARPGEPARTAAATRTAVSFFMGSVPKASWWMWSRGVPRYGIRAQNQNGAVGNGLECALLHYWVNAGLSRMGGESRKAALFGAS